LEYDRAIFHSKAENHFAVPNFGYSSTMKRYLLSLLVIQFLSTSTQAGSIESYHRDPDLSPIVTAYLARDEDESFSALNTLIQEKPNKIEAHRIGMMLAMIYDRYDELFIHTGSILKKESSDLQALTLELLYQRALGHKGPYIQTLRALQKSSLEVTKEILAVIRDVELAWGRAVKAIIPEIEGSNLGILALGSPVSHDGTPLPRLKNTLERTLEAARAYPNAPVIVTGGAVYSQFTEALAMKNWLVNKGIKPERILLEDKARDTIGNALNIIPLVERNGLDNLLLITVEYHLRRSTLVFEGVFKEHKLKTKFTGLAATSDLQGSNLAERMYLERVASYRDRSRSRGFYEHGDFLDRKALQD